MQNKDELCLEPININGVDYYTIDQFASLTKKSPATIRHLLAYGNRIRKLKKNSIHNKPYIPITELTEFPFTPAGRHHVKNSDAIYHYDAQGNEIKNEA